MCGLAVALVAAAFGCGVAGSGDASPASGDGPSPAATDAPSSPDAGADADDGAAACAVGTPSDPLTVATTRGLVEGKKDGDTVAFLGVPYAAPPKGALRFAPTAPAACWSGVKKAVEPGNQCPQIDPSTQKLTGDEDCLFLNVWTPKLPSDQGAKRPVLFFIHGGAYVFGSGTQSLVGNVYAGDELARTQNAIVVTINYRLGALGFLAHPDLAAESPNHASGNYALLDMIAALRWVHDNAAAFGGDPGRVMVFGESAGAWATCELVASPLAKGLFSSALMESGACAAQARADAEAQARGLAKDVGCDAPNAAACLRGAKVEDMVKPTSLTIGDGPVDLARAHDLPWSANVDGWVLPDRPLSILRAGKHNHVPLVAGTTKHETEIFVGAGKPASCPEYESSVRTTFAASAEQVLKTYPCNPVYPRDAMIALTTDLVFACPTRRALRAAAASQTEPVRRYWFTHVAPGLAAALRAYHTAELPFVFHTFAANGRIATPTEEQLSRTMQGYWARLAATGDPNGGDAPAWPAYAKATGSTVVLDDLIATADGVDEKGCDFWDSVDPDGP